MWLRPLPVSPTFFLHMKQRFFFCLVFQETCFALQMPAVPFLILKLTKIWRQWNFVQWDSEERWLLPQLAPTDLFIQIIECLFISMERCPQLSYNVVYIIWPPLHICMLKYVHIFCICIHTCRKAKLYIDILTITLESAVFSKFSGNYVFDP